MQLDRQGQRQVMWKRPWWKKEKGFEKRCFSLSLARFFSQIWIWLHPPFVPLLDTWLDRKHAPSPQKHTTSTQFISIGLTAKGEWLFMTPMGKRSLTLERSFTTNSKCTYCNFNKYVNPIQPPIDRLTDALVRELRFYLDEPRFGLRHKRVASVYFGGGTPSMAIARSCACMMIDINKPFRSC